jgi:hypothetical protein
MTVKPAQPGNGFDCNQPLTPAGAKAFRDQGMEFAIRYLPRTPALIPGNLTEAEIGIILGTGLALSAVQHVALPGWEPTAELGTEYGSYAAEYAKLIGLPAGMVLWLDLESPDNKASGEEIILYCQAWFNAVSAAGYIPGVYVGWGIPLSYQQLYQDLPFKNYWRAYNGPQVATRGFQLVQHPAKVLSGISYDPNTCAADLKGDMPIFLFP